MFVFFLFFFKGTIKMILELKRLCYNEWLTRNYEK